MNPAPHTPASMALLSRSRAPTRDELSAVPWLDVLQPQERAQAMADLRVVEVDAGEHVCRVGREPAFWFGVIDGLLKMSNDTAQGIPMTFTGIPAAGSVKARCSSTSLIDTTSSR